MLIINQSEVRQLLPMRECIEVMAGAFTALARGEAILPLRPVLWLPERVGALGMMPAYLADIRAMGLKVVSVFPGNHGTEYDSHQGAVLLFETGHGQFLAIRTAAVTGLATRLLARDDAGDIAILGSGVEARTHLEAMLAVRKARRIRVWSRNEEHARQFATRESRRHAIEVEPVTRAEEAVVGADIICTTTSAKEPVLQGRWLTPGMHINAIGSSVSFTRLWSSRGCSWTGESRHSMRRVISCFRRRKGRLATTTSRVRLERSSWGGRAAGRHPRRSRSSSR